MNLQKISGEISNLRIVSSKQDIVFSPQQREAAGVSAIIFAVAGMGGAAVQTSMNAATAVDDVDLFSFEINGRRFAGCTRKVTFKNDDQVEVVYDRKQQGNEVLGVIRPDTRSIWLYPYMSKGSYSAIKSGFRHWVGWSLLSCLLCVAFGAVFGLLASEKRFDSDTFFFGVSVMSISIFAALGATGLWLFPKYFRFSRCADEVFYLFGFNNPRDVDLGKTSATYRKKHNIPLDWENKAELWY